VDQLQRQPALRHVHRGAGAGIGQLLQARDRRGDRAAGEPSDLPPVLPNSSVRGRHGGGAGEGGRRAVDPVDRITFTFTQHKSWVYLRLNLSFWDTGFCN
jgi:hypothetical protein